MTGWRLLGAQLRPARADLMLLAAGSVLAGAPTFASGLLVSSAIDTGFLPGKPVTGLLWLAALAVLGVLGAYVSQALLPVMARVVEPLRDRLATAVVSSGLISVVMDESARDGTGAMAVRATEHVESVRTLVIALLRTAFGMVLTIVLALAGLAALVPLVALAIVPFLLVGLAGYVMVVRRLMRCQRTLLLAEEGVGEGGRLVLTARRDIEACSARERALRPALDDVDAAADAARHAARLGWWRSLVPAAAIQAPVLVMLGLAPWLTNTMDLSAGDLVGGVIYIVRGLAPAVGFLVSGGTGWLVQLGLVSERLTGPTPPAPPETGDLFVTPAAALDLCVSGVSFAYSPNAAPVLSGADLTVPFGTHLAVVGPSGVGKSTLAALLVGVRLPQAGQVTVGGANVGCLPPELVHHIMAFIPQESYIFAGTVRENLSYLGPEATDFDLTEAVTRFGLGLTVARLGGLDGIISAGGDTLSAGERQRIALARTWLSPAAIVVLDEATCHLDPVAEEAAEAELRRRGGTLIVVAHRISSAMRADVIAVVDAGQIVVGTHEHMLRHSCQYARLVGYWQTTQRSPQRRRIHRARATTTI